LKRTRKKSWNCHWYWFWTSYKYRKS